MTPTTPLSADPESFGPEEAAEGLRLGTLILLRWMAICGQIAALLVAAFHFGIHVPFVAASVTIAVAVLANLISTFAFSRTRRLSEGEATLTLLLDVIQLGVLLYLTGGINNPFALLILAPVTISAAALPIRRTLIVGAGAVALVTLMTLDHVDLRDAHGVVMELPRIFRFGTWLALVIGIVFIGVYTHRVAKERRVMSEALIATQMALAREQKLTDLGGVVAAAAHELGTPLATIKLVTGEMLDDLPAESADLREDLALIRDQTDRCRDILRSMGRAGKDDLHLRHAPLEAVVRESAEPHAARGRTVHFDFPAGERQPEIRRRPEVIHGLRNLIQNAVDFSTAHVSISGRWTADDIVLRIEDDGPGYPAQVLSRIGEPYMRQRRAETSRRPGYEGMGLGLFIAKTLLERTGAGIEFFNGPGAVVEVTWPRATIEAERAVSGQNEPFGA